MRPTRWTKRHRATKFGRGGWRIGRYGFGYTHPVTGDGYSTGWDLRQLLEMRRQREHRRVHRLDEYPLVSGVAGVNRPKE